MPTTKERNLYSSVDGKAWAAAVARSKESGQRTTVSLTRVSAATCAVLSLLPSSATAMPPLLPLPIGLPSTRPSSFPSSGTIARRVDKRTRYCTVCILARSRHAISGCHSGHCEAANSKRRWSAANKSIAASATRSIRTQLSGRCD